MGIQDKGAFGGFRNKTGPLVGRIVAGQNVITAIPRKSTTPPTVKQLDQRKKFGLITRYLSGISNLIRIGYQERQLHQSPMNKAVQYHLRNAVTGVSPDFLIDHAKVRYSVGKSPMPAQIEVQGLVGAKADYSWGISSGQYSLPTDLVTLLVYNPEKNRFVFLEGAAARSELGFSLQMPANFVGDTIHCYLSFVSLDGKVVSNSEYAGQLIVV
ncbi:hypothetical protein AAKU52_000683 [Pedobacter sp. CG_S7]|uniref:DUF6266 family protein n=1 Tax=Pedobacter sp. CG_S7 TaxID=3143930 RepID=UPI0033918694